MRRQILCLAAALLSAPGHPVAAETTLTILTHYTDAQRAPLTACLRDYERDHPGVHIVHLQAEIEDYLQTLITGRLSGTSPDIYNIYSVWSAQLVQAGVLDTPPPDIAAMIRTAYAPSTLQAIKVADAIWGIPTEVSTFMLIYNKKLFRDAGIDAPPRDWSQVVADAARITRRNFQGKLTTAGFAFGPTIGGSVYPFVAQLLSRGIPPFTSGLAGTNLTTTQSVDVLGDQARLFKDHSTDATIQVRDFPSGAVGMMIFANWYKDVLRQAFGSAMDETVGVAPIPAGDDWRTVQYAFFWAVDSTSPNKTEAWKLLAWLNTPRAPGHSSCTGAMLGQLGALTGNLADVAASPEAFGDAFSKPFSDAIASGRAGSLPNVPRSAEIQDRLHLAIGRAWSHQQTPQAALQEADQAITAILTDAD